MGKYFGTDGFRGTANENLTADHAYKVGRFLGWYYGELKRRNGDESAPRIVIGKDTRRSSYMFEYSLVGGLTASGADAYLLHVTTTPSVAYISRVDSFDCGIMISASHNPYYDNGIKLINGRGEKMDDGLIRKIEEYLDSDEDSIPYALRDAIGVNVDYVAGRNRYVGYLISLARHSYKNMRIGLDCSNGSTWEIAKNVFSALGTKVFVINNEPNGLNINENCGSTHIGALQALVREKELDAGFAFDGDADRCIAVDENGDIVDGDSILYICGKDLYEKGNLKSDTVVTTVMSNMGLYKAFDKAGIRYEITDVGDRNVYECMNNNGYSIGGEQSGHIIFSNYATTGDGVLTAIMLMETMLSTRKNLSELREGFKVYPQVLKNVRVQDKDMVINDEDVKIAVKKVEHILGSEGRILLRKSGTEPLIRIMVEAASSDLCNECINTVYEEIKGKGYCND